MSKQTNSEYHVSQTLADAINTLHKSLQDSLKLAKLLPATNGIREVSRYVKPETKLQIISKTI